MGDQPGQEYIGDTAPVTDPKIAELGRVYAEKRDAWQALGSEMASAKQELRTALLESKCWSYDVDGVQITRTEQQDEIKVKVREDKEED